MHEVLVNRLGGLSLPRKSAGRLTDRPDMTLDVYRGRKTTMQRKNTTGYGVHRLITFINDNLEAFGGHFIQYSRNIKYQVLLIRLRFFFTLHINVTETENNKNTVLLRVSRNKL